MEKEKFNYLGSLQEELEAVELSGKFVDSVDEELGKNDTVLGELPIEVKAMRTVMARKAKELKEIKEAGNSDETTVVRFCRISREARTLCELSWLKLEALYPGKPLKVVKGFKVVEPGKSEHEEALEDFHWLLSVFRKDK
ncbi:MAG: hypothetical protein LBU27_09500 [Candidatus Peribacteria bacterium]|jgi:uncharacterized protein YifE (UPF0438 family)|nr:hypothetical protein [Candidatus Peribacteria bacterium]